MDIAIFGAGIAGLMTAITMRAHGHHCRIYERLRKSHDAGMGFILVPEAIECLQNLGVPLAGKFSGTRLESYYARNSAGTLLHEEPMPAGSRSIRRRNLMAALASALSAAGTNISDAELVSLELDTRGYVTGACLASGETLTADLYVGAEGVRSRCRKALFPGWPAPESRVPEVVGLVRSPETVRWAGNHFNKFHAEEGGIAVGVLPVDAQHVIWFLQFDARRFPLPAEDAPACRSFVQDLIGQWAMPIPHLLAKTDFSRVHLWRPVDSDLVPYFAQGNLALVGDAAHPLLPFTSQGVSSAVADAVALATLVSDGTDLNTALTAYSAERRRECAPFVARGRELSQNFLQPQEMVLPIAESNICLKKRRHAICSG